jgi:pyrimidine-nucleoside phosphorylase
MKISELIAKKRDGGEHTAEEIEFLIRSIVSGQAPDYQTSAWLMAAYLRGLTSAETLALTYAMRDSGEKVVLNDMPGFKLDKHSTGGVGDKTTLVLVPLLASAGIPILKMSGRGLGHTGGTIDKLEAIPGFRTDLDLEQARRQTAEVGAALIGQSLRLAPADKILYALRDVTATVDSIPLIASSIMSKKLASSPDGILLDVKVGLGAFMQDIVRARELAQTLVEIGRGAGVKTVAALSDMDEPLGYAVGNALEVMEACAVLTGRGRVEERFRELCLLLAGRALLIAEAADDELDGYAKAEKLLQSGAAAEKMSQIIAAQGGDRDIVHDPSLLPQAPTVRRVRSLEEGYVEAINARAIGMLCMSMGAGRAHKEEAIDPAVGVVLKKKTGDPVAKGEILADLHLRSVEQENTFAEQLRGAFAISPETPRPKPILFEVIGG